MYFCNITNEKPAMKRYLCELLALTASMTACAITPAQVRWHNEANDTIEIERLISVGIPVADNGRRVATIGRQLIGRPYVAATLEGTPEMLTVNVDELDCTTFVETVATLARVASHRGGWLDFIRALEEIRYRGGNMDGYGSRLHYISEWSLDNGMRGVLKEYTREAPRVNWMVKTIDYMSSHRDSYPALKDDAEFERVKSVESGLHSHRFPYIKAGDLASKQTQAWLKDGDIVAFVTGMQGLDVTHMGIIIDEGGIKKVLHASSKKKEVVIDELPLTDFVKRGGYKGIRVFRIID